MNLGKTFVLSAKAIQVKILIIKLPKVKKNFPIGSFVKKLLPTKVENVKMKLFPLIAIYQIEVNGARISRTRIKGI